MPESSPIFVKTEVVLIWLMQHTAKFPRHERFRLTRHLDDALFAFHESLVRAAHAESPRPHLAEADVQLDLVRAYLKLALELKYTSPNQYAYASQQIAEIGRLLGGWIKSPGK